MREWNSGTDAKYRFTGKERDIETNYDYFGARYYDARIGRWGGTDPLFEKHINFTPYNYVLNNQMLLIDPDGRQNKSIYGPTQAALKEEGGTGSVPRVSTSELSQVFSSWIGSTVAGLGAALGTIQWSRIWTEEHPYNLSQAVEVNSSSEEESQPREQDLRPLDEKEVKKLAKSEGDPSVEKLKERILKDNKINSKEAKKFDVYKDKESGKHFIKQKPNSEGKRYGIYPVD
ncbi:MAG: RHS repeat-associated core domain-containing protein [Ignavibacteria bacterium]|nr:RHS repeat-associated core domain-containing protein [Ignavibacteria bacterium]